MVINPHNITRHELIGLAIEVVKSSSRSLIGKKGVIVDETRNTLTIRHKGKLTKLPKAAIVFKTEIGGKQVEVEGKSIVGRPEDRLKK